MPSTLDAATQTGRPGGSLPVEERERFMIRDDT